MIKVILHECKAIIDEKHNPTSYNIGINIGCDAGQTVMRLHLHLTPRCRGDVDNPGGGIRRLKPQSVYYDG